MMLVVALTKVLILFSVIKILARQERSLSVGILSRSKKCQYARRSARVWT